ncbi:hypothetical protein ACFSTI_27680 [Rhizorhabdus histidinilytica]
MTREPQVRIARVSALNALPAQFLIGFCIAILLPAYIRYGDFQTALGTTGFANSFIAATVALILGMTMLSRVTAFPGTRTFGYILPSFIGSFGLAIAALLALRLEYSRIYLTSTFLSSIAVFFVLSIYLLPRTRRRFYVVPGFDLQGLTLPPRSNGSGCGPRPSLTTPRPSSPPTSARTMIPNGTACWRRPRYRGAPSCTASRSSNR